MNHIYLWTHNHYEEILSKQPNSTSYVFLVNVRIPLNKDGEKYEAYSAKGFVPILSSLVYQISCTWKNVL